MEFVIRSLPELRQAETSFERGPVSVTVQSFKIHEAQEVRKALLIHSHGMHRVLWNVNPARTWDVLGSAVRLCDSLRDLNAGIAQLQIDVLAGKIDIAGEEISPLNVCRVALSARADGLQAEGGLLMRAVVVV
ncbi:hypothetical protein PR202_gb28266 [Eleusine coracana subsp. coracana]|uniref:Uncharacterized protein n=1 Tax=Eleusine coracana subsp. coracana TaxID=191504 RepID=A0AAV5FX77_ELECO|nr:hypothetical protein PR202_gb28266 [Eleusine coracana subsp. coracana]